MESYKIFMVEDDNWYADMLAYHLSLNPDYSIQHFSNGKDCLDNMHQKPDLITIDFSLPDFKGDQLFQKIKALNDEVPVIMISAQEDVSIAVNMLKLGLADYLIKDDHTKEQLWKAVVKVRENGRLKQEVQELRAALGQKFSFSKNFKGQSAALQRVFSMIQKASSSNINVSVTGETGTGKEMVAKAIHYSSDRRSGNFVAVNMAAIPAELIESELFGHEKGAFTGAIARKPGKFEEACGGTLFLDEIGELELSMQSKLLRVLQEREVTRVGGNETIKLDIRLVIATHKNLANEVKEGNFREDLFYRVMGMPIELPPLRERGDDVLILSKHFVDEFVKENKTQPIVLSPGAKEKLMRYNYPGNIRELKAVIDLAAVMCNGEEITAGDISFPAVKDDRVFTTEEKTFEQYGYDIVKFYLKKYSNDISTVANKLEIGKSTIYKMIQRKAISI